MENQVQQLEELLARVQRNRARMTAGGQSAADRISKTGSAVATVNPPVEEKEPPEADMPLKDGGVIDLVNPTSIPPASTSPVMSAEKADDDFSSVTPVSAAPSRPVNEKTEDDFSSVAPLSVSPKSPVAQAGMDAELPPSMAPASPVAEKQEDDFSSVAPVSVAPVEPAPSVDNDSDTAADVPPPSLLPVEPAKSALTEEAADDAAELELVNTDTVSMNPGIPQEVVSYAMRGGSVADSVPAEPVEPVKPVKPVDGGIEKGAPETRSFQKTATASGDIISIQNELPPPKIYTVEAVLGRAWQLGK